MVFFELLGVVTKLLANCRGEHCGQAISISSVATVPHRYEVSLVPPNDRIALQRVHIYNKGVELTAKLPQNRRRPHRDEPMSLNDQDGEI